MIPVPFVFIAPEVWQAATGGGTHNLSTSTADVLGNAAIIFFLLMLAVTPVVTMTGVHWVKPLRRDYGVAMACAALLDLVFAATVTGDHIHGGLVTRVAGHTFLLAGTVAVLLLVPMLATANHRSQRWLGRHWHAVHRATYLVWIVIGLHMLALFGLAGFFYDYVIASVPLVIVRLPPVHRWFVTGRREHRYLGWRWVTGALLAAMYVYGVQAFVREFVSVGLAAIELHPS